MTDRDQIHEVLPGFCRMLRARGGIRISPAQIINLLSAVAEIPHMDLEDLYWCCRSTIGIQPVERPAYDRLFAEYFAGAQEPETVEDSDSASESAPGSLDAVQSGDTTPIPVTRQAVRDPDDSEQDHPVGSDASRMETLHVTPFAACTPEEQAELRALIRRIRIHPPMRPVRRMSPATRAGRLDLRRTFQNSLRHQGEIFPRWRDRQQRPRRIVMMLDVSRSMSPYSRLLLHFAHAIVSSGFRVEVVCFGTRVTRITRLIRKDRSERGLERAAAAVLDWDGGTRIGEAIRVAQTIGTIRGSLRDSVVVVLSDGLEQDDPENLVEALGRLRRTCHSVVWANPLAGDPRYEPLTAGMLAALPYIDVLCPADTLQALEHLATSLSVGRIPGGVAVKSSGR